MRTRITDVSGVQQLENERGYRNAVGHTIVVRFKGTETECGLALNQLILNGGVIDANIAHDAGGYYILAVTYSAESAVAPGGTTPGAASVVTTWTRDSAMLEKRLWNLPAVKEVMAILSQTEKVQFRAKIESFWAGIITDIELGAYFGKLTAFNNQVLGPEIVQLMMEAYASGNEAYRVAFFQVKRTQVGPPALLINNDATNNRFWSRATLVSQPTMPIEFQGVCPAGFYRQDAAQIQVTSALQWTVTQNWDYTDEYSLFIYDTPI